MCGIAGIVTVDRTTPDASKLDSMRAALSHRGPDGHAVWVSGDTGLVHTRLAIIDLETGEQPLFMPDGTALVANGEIYNYIELRGELIDADFSTHSDCEPILYYYRKYGLDFANSLRGMYALAIFDPKERRLILSRDPFGIKPLYFSQSAGGFAFASEPQALLRAGFGERRLRERSISELLQLQFTTGAETPYMGIQRVLPGETIAVANGRIVERRRRDALPDKGPVDIEERPALKRVEDALLNSVEMHQRSDVPYAMFLSGGVDSSAILALMARLNDRPVHAFTAGFTGSAATDERNHARTVAGSLGADHEEITFGAHDFWTLLPAIAAAMDEPVADYAILPTWKLAQEASKSFKVVLSGEGGDEIFGGYGRYRNVMRPIWFGGREMRRRGAMDGLNILKIPASGWREGFADSETIAARDGRSRLQVAQATDCADWLSNDLLAKLDRCLMAHGVEGRTPFLDPAVANAAFCLPDRLKIRKGQGKWILRKWLDGAAPEAAAFASKRGFTVPVGDWISTQGERLGPLVASQAGVAERCRPSAVEAVFRSTRKHEAFAAWTLLFFALWHQYHIVNGAAGGDVFDCLSEA
ncbi:MAG: Asparagine synthetase [glutamine-hydrolyzing] 1 [Alphaproteobacteria bacterium MarineAlpha11_Bin1]|nr:MAG: Asparagine synthetase [glutamine-hydrolyzing] 1 [Alphaproteobacteria bacterium MarineAlpha11_Bin1]|tara:strand:+ start:4856 stop:6616 length:1761 start_codon:yes stop_codon:yes gene_type:complete